MSAKLIELRGIFTAISAKHAELMSPAFVEVDAEGRIVDVRGQALKPGASAASLAGFERIRHDAYALPTFVNAHSHAFQYAMIGRSEFFAAAEGRDNFWSWREQMYRLSAMIHPENLMGIAARLYATMVEQGYSHVYEFHYLHHDERGRSYGDEAVLSEAILEGARLAGIELTLVPVFYKNGGFGKTPTKLQKRFLSKDADSYLRLRESIARKVARFPNARLASGFHSLRAADPADIRAVVQALGADEDYHIHIAEQTGEVEACLAHHGKRPVELLATELLAAGVPLSKAWHLIHATHMDADELRLVAETKAQVVLCPTTEANLGDGIFPLNEFLAQRGSFLIGSDSHVACNPFQELMMLEYSNRLQLRSRNVASLEPGEFSALSLLMQALSPSTQEPGAVLGPMDEARFWAQGSPFHAVLLDANHHLFAAKSPEEILSTLVYCFDRNLLAACLHNGQIVSEFGRHKLDAALSKAYCEAVKPIYS